MCFVPQHRGELPFATSRKTEGAGKHNSKKPRCLNRRHEQSRTDRTSVFYVDRVFLTLKAVRNLITVLVGQSLSAFCTTSLENVSAVGCLHSLSEAVFLFSLTLFGLVCSEHLMHLLDFFRKRLAYSTYEAVLRFYTMTVYIILQGIYFCQGFFSIFFQ